MGGVICDEALLECTALPQVYVLIFGSAACPDQSGALF